MFNERGILILDTLILYYVLSEVPDVSHLSSPSIKGPVSSGDLPAVCQSEAVLPQPLAHFPQQLPVKPQGQPLCLYHANTNNYHRMWGLCTDPKRCYIHI